MRKLVCLGIVVASGIALADTTPQPLPLVQAWTNTAALAAADNWSGVPGIVGYRGDALVSGVGIDPQTVTADGSTTPVDVNVNQTNTAFVTGGVTEFEITNPTIGIKGSGTAKAPHVVLATNTAGHDQIRVRYTLRDLDGSPNSSIQPVALQWRAGTTGDFVNIPEAFVADATTGPMTNGPDIPIHVALPVEATQQPVLQIRIITTDALGTDEYVGIDNIAVTDAASAAGMSAPPAVHAGDPIVLSATVSPAAAPVSTGHAITCNLTSIGGPATQALADGGNNTFSLSTTVGATVPAGTKSPGCALTDAQGRITLFTIDLTVLPLCGDGRLEGSEACDDDGVEPGDGCSGSCTVEPGWTCTGSPSVCTDTDECAAGTDTCDDNATCTNAPAGSFSCACNSGYAGNGMTCTAVCGDGIVVTGEACDDDDTDAGDGCSASCTVEPGYSCSGMPSVCTEEERCGDGAIDTGEQCDDGDTSAGDGCNGSCEIEPSYTCSGEPSTCIADRDADGIANASDNCPMVANPNQEDGDGDGVGDACEITNPDQGDGGGCCSSGSDNTGGIVLAFAIGLVLRRRRARS